MIDLFRGPKVYFIQSGQSGPIKIGYTANIMHRFTALQLATYMELRLRGLIVGAHSLEQELLVRFKAHRVRGEWFHPVESLLDFISSLDTTGVELFDRYQFKKTPHPGYVLQKNAEQEQYVCRSCSTILEGKFANDLPKYIALTRAQLHPKVCEHCKKKTDIIRKNLCKTCYTYKARTGSDRPLIAVIKKCKNCQKTLDAYAGKKRCWTCYVYLRRMKKDRSQELISKANA